MKHARRIYFYTVVALDLQEMVRSPMPSLTACLLRTHISYHQTTVLEQLSPLCFNSDNAFVSRAAAIFKSAFSPSTSFMIHLRAFSTSASAIFR